MGLFDFLGKSPLSEKKIAKIAKLACNPYAQPDVRVREMQRLLEDGSDRAIRAVLKRFAANASGNIADEDEKHWLEDAIVDMGGATVEPLRSFIRTDKQLTYALRAFNSIVGAAESVKFFIEVLNAYGPEDYRAQDAKLQLIWQLAEDLHNPEVLTALTPFLDDHSDDVRWAVVDLIERCADDGLVTDAALRDAAACLGRLVVSEESSTRIMQRAAEVLCRREWQISSEAAELATALDGQYFLDKKRFVRKRVRRA